MVEPRLTGRSRRRKEESGEEKLFLQWIELCDGNMACVSYLLMNRRIFE